MENVVGWDGIVNINGVFREGVIEKAYLSKGLRKGGIGYVDN